MRETHGGFGSMDRELLRLHFILHKEVLYAKTFSLEYTEGVDLVMQTVNKVLEKTKPQEIFFFVG